VNPYPIAILGDDGVDTELVTNLRVLDPMEASNGVVSPLQRRVPDPRAAPRAASGLPPTEMPSFISEQVTAAHRFYHDIESRPQPELAVVCGGWEECSADYKIDRLTFPYLSLEFVAAGEGELKLGGCSYPLGAGTVFSYGPGISQMIRTSTHHRLRKYFVDFIGRDSRRLMRDCELEPGRAIQLSGSPEIRDAFDTLIRFADSKRSNTTQLCALQLEVLIRLTSQSSPPSSASERRARSTFERCRQHIDQNFIRFRTLEEAAQSCHVDVSYLCRLFHRFESQSPFRYLQRRQMAWAAERLRSSDLLIREVADELGIEAFQFSRTFKRLNGVSPTQFLNTWGE
jgi:AraC-like DNA-binding protein